MTPAARERSQIRVPMLWVSGVAWILLIVAPGSMASHVRHVGSASSLMSLSTPLEHSPAVSVALGWSIMVTAMMVPVLIAPVRHVRARSYGRRRGRSTMLFVGGYGAVWMAAGYLLLSLAFAARLWATEPFLPIALVAAVAVVWQCSPVKQRCLNRGHAHPPLAAVGPAADLDVLRFGTSHGFWCVGSCWALMLVPLIISRADLVAMAAVSIWVAAERIEGPKPLFWGVRVPLKAARLAIAQGLILWRSVSPRRHLHVVNNE